MCACGPSSTDGGIPAEDLAVYDNPNNAGAVGGVYDNGDDRDTIPVLSQNAMFDDIIYDNKNGRQENGAEGEEGNVRPLTSLYDFPKAAAAPAPILEAPPSPPPPLSPPPPPQRPPLPPSNGKPATTAATTAAASNSAGLAASSPALNNGARSPDAFDMCRC